MRIALESRALLSGRMRTRNVLHPIIVYHEPFDHKTLSDSLPMIRPEGQGVASCNLSYASSVGVLGETTFRKSRNARLPDHTAITHAHCGVGILKIASVKRRSSHYESSRPNRVDAHYLAGSGPVQCGIGSAPLFLVGRHVLIAMEDWPR
ncbi:uncharacterized protein LAESUDRAFT_330068 [Laetiporus sulphureus 93-53]|uniref:Uncharacterized protein n=1 Tax=Laetiporus sulphureus 93-53 TaxID=1314785 RepID=A0A165CXA6_9APHY|nr:uncharacterized protein LAESUDRAFT_330068 [Laetiporus sulphureus 93-53]KZT03648.1 hypothetical protein LAESUDRAFT_330068 [Laetiporus sulphureus 93-53]